ncbi:unnamed protein product [Phytophthora lilii]|uniref:Unnamed protein product n=1 Tax=Phytophthora lilii TaxID=2077276 RepID=A0A9W6U3P1_9STRA|nr:unnamed protein product [Phytophthora lilii]
MKSNESSEWAKAMKAELEAHADNGSWTLVRTDVKFPAYWVTMFAKKRNEHGRVVLSVVVAKAYVTQQLDVDTAFLNSKLKEQVFMEVPYGVPNADNMVCKLNKATYGLKQAASAWHANDQTDALNRRRCQPVQPTRRESGDEPVRVWHKVDEVAVADHERRTRGHEDQAVQSIDRMLVVYRKLYAPRRGVHCDAVVAVLGEPGQQHWKAAIAMRVLRYLKTTTDFGIVCNSNNGKVMLEA